MNISAPNTSERGGLRMSGQKFPLACKNRLPQALKPERSPLCAVAPYQKELEFVIALVWMTSEARSETLNDTIVIDANLEEGEGVIWRVGDKSSGTCLGAALRRYSGAEIPLM